MPTPKQAHALVTYFGKAFKSKYGIEPDVNRVKARWNFDSMLMDMVTKDIQDLIDYYFTTLSPNGHSIEWFFYNYDKLAETKAKMVEDQKAQASIREQTRKRTEEWRKKTRGED